MLAFVTEVFSVFIESRAEVTLLVVVDKFCCTPEILSLRANPLL